MQYCLILCRSLTYAQRTAAALTRNGITSSVLRAPKSISEEGCSHCVKITKHDLSMAITVLDRNGIKPKHVFIRGDDGAYNEVSL